MHLPELLDNTIIGVASVRLCVALLVGGLIGIERSHHGRAAGFRTHALVCLSTAMLMLIAALDTHWMPEVWHGRIQLDPTRLAQGIMTGIGFLGAGTIVKEGLTIQGLTTAASIWTTAAIGILIGIGLYGPAAIAMVLTIGTLSAFRWLEALIPVQFDARLVIRFKRAQALSEAELRSFFARHDFSMSHTAQRFDATKDHLEYHLLVSGKRGADVQRLTAAVRELDGVEYFSLSARGE